VFRRSLICRAEDADLLRPMPNLAGVMDIWIASRLEFDGPPVYAPGAPSLYRVPDAKSDDRVDTRVVEVKNPFVKAVFNELAIRPNHAVSMANVWQRVIEKADPTDGELVDAVKEVGRSVLTAVCKGQMAIFSGPYPGD